MDGKEILGRDFVLCILSSFLSLRETLRLSLICRRVKSQLDEPFVWEYIIRSKFGQDDPTVEKTDLPERNRIHAKLRYLRWVLSQKISTAGRDVCIAGLSIPEDPKQETWWLLENGGEFGRYATLRTICWGEWYAWRRLPAGSYDLVLCTRWTTSDFNRVERPTLYQCRLLPSDTADPSAIRTDTETGIDRFNGVKGRLENGGAPLRDFIVSDKDRAALRDTQGQWVLHNFGTVHVPRAGIVTVRYLSRPLKPSFAEALRWQSYFLQESSTEAVSCISYIHISFISSRK